MAGKVGTWKSPACQSFPAMELKTLSESPAPLSEPQLLTDEATQEAAAGFGMLISLAALRTESGSVCYLHDLSD